MSLTDDEINRLVAEHVMGYEVRWVNTVYYLFSNNNKSEHLPDYCNSWEGMGEVIDKMNPDSIHFCQTFGKNKKHRERWMCSLFLDGEKDPVAREFADSAPKAVALAALKAKGINT